MKKIKKIIIDNFQCHDHTIIEPAENGLTVITGPTDHGKSAVVRALRWLFYNRPQGDDFIRHGQSECKVSVELDNGITVMRRRTSSLNQYWINDQCFEGFGNGIPLEVQQTLGIYSYEVSDQTLNLNIARQLSGPFLGSSITAPTRAKILGKLAGTETIDKANKKLGTDIYRADQNKKNLKKDIKEKKEQIEDYSWVEPLGEILEEAKNRFNQIIEKKERLEKLKEIKNKLHKLKSKEMKLNNYQTLLINVDKAVDNLKNIKNNKDLKDDLQSISIKLSNLNEKRSNLNINLKKLISVKEVNTKIDKLKSKNDKLNKYQNLLVQYTDIEKAKESLRAEWSQLSNINEVRTKFKDIELTINNLVSLDKVHDKLHQLNKKKNILNEFYEEIKNTPNFNQKINELNSTKKKLSELKSIQKKLNKIEEMKKIKNKKIKKAKKQAAKARKKYSNILKKEGICPTCGSEVDSNNVRRVI